MNNDSNLSIEDIANFKKFGAIIGKLNQFAVSGRSVCRLNTEECEMLATLIKTMISLSLFTTTKLDTLREALVGLDYAIPDDELRDKYNSLLQTARVVTGLEIVEEVGDAAAEEDANSTEE